MSKVRKILDTTLQDPDDLFFTKPALAYSSVSFLTTDEPASADISGEHVNLGGLAGQQN